MPPLIPPAEANLGSVGGPAVLPRSARRALAIAPAGIFAGLSILSAWLVLRQMGGLSFIGDEWHLLLDRHGSGAGAYLQPHNEHIVVAPAAIYKALVATFGIASAVPFQVVCVALFVATACLLFAYASTRTTPWLALALVAPLLFLGPGAVDIVWPFQMGFAGSLACGIAMLLALQRSDPTGDRLACAALVGSIAFATIGLSFAAGAAVSIALGRRPRRGRIWIVAVPVALYGLWWIGWGHTAESHMSLANALHEPGYVVDAASQVLASLIGLATPAPPHGLSSGRMLLAVVVIAGFLRLRVSPRPSRQIYVVLAIGLSFWVLAGLNASTLRPPTADRYQLPGAVFVLLIAVELLRGVKIPRMGWAVLAVLSCASILSNLGSFESAADRTQRSTSDSELADFAALRIAQPSIADGYRFNLSGYGEVNPQRLRDLFAAHGEVAPSEAVLAGMPDSLKLAADLTLIQSLRISLTAAGSPDVLGPCRTGRTMHLGPGSYRLYAGSRSEPRVWLRRFGPAPGVLRGRISPGGSTLEIPPDASTRTWTITFTDGSTPRLCG